MAVKERKETGPSGIADVKFLTKSVRISFVDGDTYDLPLESVEKRQSALYNVTLSADKTRAYLHPLPSQQYILSYKQMGNRTIGRIQGQPDTGLPTNKIMPERTGIRKDNGKPFRIPSEIIFTAQFQIESEGPYKGMIATTNVPYSFQAPAAGEGCDFYDSRRNLERIEKFFNVVGGINIALNVPFVYTPDPVQMLTSIEKILQKADTRFLGSLGSSGFVDLESLSSVPAELLPQKKSSKKGKK